MTVKAKYDCTVKTWRKRPNMAVNVKYGGKVKYESKAKFAIKLNMSI